MHCCRVWLPRTHAGDVLCPNALKSLQCALSDAKCTVVVLSLAQTRGNYSRASGGVLCSRSWGTWGDGEQAFRDSERELRKGDRHRRNKVCHSRCAINGLKHICSFGDDAFIPREAVSRWIPFSHCSVVVKIPRWRGDTFRRVSASCSRENFISFVCENAKSREREKIFFFMPGFGRFEFFVRS